jgi:chromosomal replication initiation ATPase DnaA
MREPEIPRQLPLDLGFSAGLTRDDLVVSQANGQAVALIDRWPDWPAPVVVLAGPAGSGKSHLAAIWQASSAALRLQAASIGENLAGVDGAGAVVIDDAGCGQLDQNGLFHLINTIRGGGGSLLLTARRFPLAWGVTLPDETSRLKAAATIENHEPEDLLLAGVITKLFADRQIEVDQTVVQYLVRRIERSLSTAISVVDRLDRAALEQKTRISRFLAAEVVEAIDQGQWELDI